MPEEPKKRSLARRVVAGIISLGLNGAFIAIAVVAVGAGAAFMTERAEATAEATAQVAPPTPVSAAPIVFEDGYTVTRRFVGQVEARETVNLSFELAGRLDEVLVGEGDPVEMGQLIARLDTDLLLADRERLNASKKAVLAQLDFADQTVERNEALRDRGFASQERLDEAMATQRELTARVAEIDANLDSIRLQLEKSELHAPMAGRITLSNVDGGETLAAGQTILGLVAEGAPLVRIGLPLNVELSAIDATEITVGARTYSAGVFSVRPDIDPVTRTRTVLFEIESDVDLALGQTASLAATSRVEERGVWVPTRSLKEGARGTWTLQVVDQDNMVRQATVELLYTSGDRVFARGTFPEGTKLLTEGPQRVTAGQLVEVIEEGA
ncbi:MAG: efflux RND transporter periplasmic adaptor subunit [Pseudomonadota bacterium]